MANDNLCLDKEDFEKKIDMIHKICVQKVTYICNDIVEKSAQRTEDNYYIQENLSISFQTYCLYINIFSDKITKMLFDLFCVEKSGKDIYFRCLENNEFRKHIICNKKIAGEIVIPLLTDIHLFVIKNCKKFLAIRGNHIANTFKHDNKKLDIKRNDTFIPSYKFLCSGHEFGIEDIFSSTQEIINLTNYIYERISMFFEIFGSRPIMNDIPAEKIIYMANGSTLENLRLPVCYIYENGEYLCDMSAKCVGCFVRTCDNSCIRSIYECMYKHPYKVSEQIFSQKIETDENMCMWAIVARAFYAVQANKISENIFYEIIKEFISLACTSKYKNVLFSNLCCTNYFISKIDFDTDKNLKVGGDFVLTNDQIANICNILNSKYVNKITEKNYAKIFYEKYKKNIVEKKNFYYAILDNK